MKKINNILIFIFSLISICFFVKDINFGNNSRLLGDISIILVFFLPRIFKKVFKFKISSYTEFIYIIFIIIAQFLGSIVNLYNTTWWYDLFAHFVSGTLTAILALLILNVLKKDDNKFFNIIFIISFVLMIASLWEFVEFGADTFLKMNVQHSIETGVKDTMEDMLIAFCGCIIISITYLLDKNNKLNKIIDALK